LDQTADRDRAIEKKFLASNDCSDPGKIKDLELYNSSIERKLLEEQKRFNNSKIGLDEVREKVEITERTIGSANKKIEAVKREIEKARKNRAGMNNQPSKGGAIAKMFSTPPPVIVGKTIPKPPTAKSGLFSFFRRG
jgi:hypothetical protein